MNIKQGSLAISYQGKKIPQENPEPKEKSMVTKTPVNFGTPDLKLSGVLSLLYTITTVMPEGILLGVPVVIGGENLPSPVGTGITDLPNILYRLVPYI